MFRELIATSRALLYSPQKVFLICVTVLFFGLLFDGTFIRLWGLWHEQHHLVDQIEDLKSDTTKLHAQVERVKEPAYIERLARDRFDWVAEDELIFVFDDIDE